VSSDVKIHAKFWPEILFLNWLRTSV
jgi:hypothetical protein